VCDDDDDDDDDDDKAEELTSISAYLHVRKIICSYALI
jgi:hypothetical protein